MVGEDGVAHEGLEQALADGAAKIRIAEGTAALTAEGTPLQTISVQPVDEPLMPPSDCNIIGLAFDFGPEGATFDPPAGIIISYDPSMCPAGVAEENLVIAYFDIEEGQWVHLECKVDTVNHAIYAEVSHFTLFAVLAKTAPALTPAHLNWALIGGIIAAVLVIGFGAFFILSLSRKRAAGVGR